MKRELQTRIDTSSWTSKAHPAGLTPFVSSIWAADVLSALVTTAILTRPPVSHGFQLSDLWAWMRYGPALANTSELQRSEWRELDPHQKTILSDDFGMGFTAAFLNQNLDFRYYADTTYVIKVADPSSSFRWFHNKPKRGPSKSPDFLVLDGANRLNILECKGTQKSPDALESYMTDPGDRQKKNLALPAAWVNERLVGGVFIPQFASADQPTLRIHDPEYKELLSLLDDMDPEVIGDAVSRVFLSKLFAVAGLSGIAEALLSEHAIKEGTLGSIDEIERSGVARLTEDITELTLKLPFPQTYAEVDGIKISSGTFRATVPKDIYSSLVTSNDLSKTIREFVANTNNRWDSKESDLYCELATPFGFRFYLNYDGEFGANDSRNWMQGRRERKS